MYNDISSKSSSSNDINSKSCYNNSKSYTFNDSNSKSCSSNYIYSKPDNQYIPDFHAEQVYTSPERQFDRSNFHTISGGKDNFTIREAYEVEPDYVRRLRHTETETETETEGIRNKMVTKSNGRMGQFSQKITSHNQQQFTEENKGNRIQYSQPVTIPNNLKPQVCYESNLNPQVCYESQLNPLVYYESPVNNGREITTKISKPQYSFDVQIPETSESTAKFKREFFREKLRTLTKDSEYTEAQIIIMKKEAYPEKYGKKVIKYNSNELIQPTNYKPLDNKYDSSATEEYIEPYEEISDQLKEILREKLPTLDKDSGYTEQQIKKFHRMAYPPKCKESENGIKQNSYTTNNNEIYSQVNIGTVQSQKLSIKSNTNFNSSQYNEEDAYAEIWGKGNNKSPIKESSPFIEPAFHPVAESSQLNINTKFNSKKLDSIDNLSSGNDVKNRSINSDNSKPSRRPKSDFVEAFKSYQKSRGLPIYDPGDYTESFVDYYSSVNSTDYNSDTDGAIQYMLMIDHHESDIGGQ
ncbi:uncharacterized protein RJT21DRAFT_122756 [Scheffersomyces amazonensis]|uniref:uncharacterized protein n=1 Tax=Scheffersomyces amazonensis TaxID=1078765 RepID=UPI00315DF605